MLSPFVYWAQSEKQIFIKVDLQNVKQPNVTLEERKLQFKAKGLGAKGCHTYGFTLEFANVILPEDSSCKVLDNKVDFILAKKENGWWSRLTSQLQKPVWLKVDFDRWQSEDDINENEPRDVREDFPDLYDKLQKEEMGYKKEDFVNVYLILYNFLCYCGFLYVVSILGILFLKDGVKAFNAAYASVGTAIKFLILMQFAELFNAFCGFTKTSVFTCALQTTARALVLFGLVVPEEEIQQLPVTFYLFLVWSAVEIIRYPYYITQLYRKDNPVLTWLRYTVWIPLYPLGFYCEAVIIYKSLSLLDLNRRFSVDMPNAFNFIFHFPTFLRIYLLFFFIPGMYSVMSYMYKARTKKLSKTKGLKNN